jgi:hypothetical protein
MTTLASILHQQNILSVRDTATLVIVLKCVFNNSRNCTVPGNLSVAFVQTRVLTGLFCGMTDQRFVGSFTAVATIETALVFTEYFIFEVD